MKKLRVLFSIILLAGLTIIYFWDILFSDSILTFRDLSRYYYPLRLFAFEQIKSGVFPFWNPFVGSGHPLFAALQSVVLYPLSVIYLLPNYDFAFNLFIIAHIFLGGAFFYLLMQELKFNHLSSLISAVTFMFGGYLIAVINLTTTLTAAIWFPLVFIFYNRAINHKKIINIFLTSFFFGLMFLAGEPTPLYSTILALGLFTLFSFIRQPRELFKNVMILPAVVIIFVLLFSFQILPFMELIQLSNRAQSAFQESVYWSFPPRDVVNFFLPFFYGPLHFQAEQPLRQDWLLLTYLGIVPIILFAVALFFRKDKISNFFKLIFVIGLILVMGKFTPLYKLFYKFIPGFGLIRYPVKFFFLSAVSFAFLCGAGWQEYWQRAQGNDQAMRKFIKRLFIGGFVAAIIFLVLWLLKTNIISTAQGYINAFQFKEKFDYTKYFLIFNVDLFNFRRLLLFFILCALLLFIGEKKKKALIAVGAMILFLIFIDLFGGKNIEVNPTIEKKVFHSQTPNIAFLKKDKSLFRVYTSAQMNKLNETLRGNTYAEAFGVSVDNLCPNRLIEYGFYDARGYFSIHNSSYAKVLSLVDTSPLPSSTNVLNMLNVKYILSPKEITDKHIRLVNKGLESFLYENLVVLPRAYLAENYLVLKEESDIANKLKSKEFNPKKEVILEEDPIKPQAIPDSVSSSDKIDRREHAEIVLYKPQEIIIVVNVLNKPKFLVLADNYYPGWQVFVDGKKDKIYKANYILRGVYLLPGRHLVKFDFNPASFKIGALISLLTLVIMIILINKQRRKKQL